MGVPAAPHGLFGTAASHVMPVESGGGCSSNTLTADHRHNIFIKMPGHCSAIECKKSEGNELTQQGITFHKDAYFLY